MIPLSTVTLSTLFALNNTNTCIHHSDLICHEYVHQKASDYVSLRCVYELFDFFLDPPLLDFPSDVTSCQGSGFFLNIGHGGTTNYIVLGGGVRSECLFQSCTYNNIRTFICTVISSIPHPDEYIYMYYSSNIVDYLFKQCSKEGQPFFPNTSFRGFTTMIRPRSS